MEVGTRGPASHALKPQDSKDTAVSLAREVLEARRKERPLGATWVSLGEAVAEAILRRFGG